jgi:membrane associated rhomboid family serine protease
MNRYTESPFSFFGGPVTRTVKLLIGVNVGVFLLQVVEMILKVNLLEQYFGLTPASVTHNLTVWQFVTYMFLHGGPFHVLINMVTLFMFGNDLERYWGTQRFLRYYFLTGIGAGVCSWLVAMNSPATIIGASGAVYGLLLAYGLLYPNRIIYLNFLIPVKVKYFVLFIGFVAFYSSIADGNGGVAHIAHLGGMLVGFLYLKGKDYLGRLQVHQEQRRRTELRKQFEIYYPELRRRIEDETKKGPTIH